MLTKKQIKRIETAAFDMCYDHIYFDVVELDGEDIEQLAEQCQVTVKDICKVLEIPRPTIGSKSKAI
jgi:hypothetical protein